MSVRILVGDCRERLAELAAESVDAIVTDPPYDLAFMGQNWDRTGVSFHPETWRAVLRVLKPGGHLLAFGGTRTFHRLTVAIEDAGFEIKDCLSWLYGSGFPKHKSLLKPAWEPIVLAKKRGAGALDIDGCRLDWDAESLARDTARRQTPRVDITGGRWGKAAGAGAATHIGNPESPAGRWPPNVCLDEAAAAMLDAQSGERPSGAAHLLRRAASSQYGGRFVGGEVEGATYGDSGGASRFMYVAKADGEERNRGLYGLDARAVHRYGAGVGEGSDPKAPVIERNHHPTVKPVALMRWLVRLVTPPGGVCLDPFMGSGSTGIACVFEERDFIGIEQEPEYARIAELRIRHAIGPMFADVAMEAAG